MDEVLRLRETAERCYRLGRAIADRTTAKVLTTLAEEADAQATRRETELKGEPPSRQPGGSRSRSVGSDGVHE
jgi:hypothetical protein